MPVKQIPSSDITLGMYIARLDRPWLETPFLFQGFEVRTQEEIDELQRLTKHVYVAIPDEEIELHEIPHNHASRLPPRSATYVTQPIEEVIDDAREGHADVSSMVDELHELAKTNQSFNLAAVTESADIMVDSIILNPDAFVWLTTIRRFDSYVYKDALACAVWATGIGRELGMDKEGLRNLATGTLLMDIGKTTLPHELVNKPTRLSHEEWDLMKSHVEQGVHMLESRDAGTPEILEIIRTHHERIDGSGYPLGLTGSQIPLSGQIAGLVDFYVSVTNPRPYAKAISPAMALQMLYEQRSRYFDEELVEAFIRVLGTYPTGSLVELSSGEVAVVSAQNPHLHLKPTVVLLLDPDKTPYDAYPLVSLADYRDRAGRPVSIARSLPNGSFGLEVDSLSL